MTDPAPRPRGLTVVAIVLAIVAAGMIPSNAAFASALWATDPRLGASLGVLLVAFPVALLVGAAGLFFQRRWARPVVMAVAAIAIVFLGTLVVETFPSPDSVLPFLHAVAGVSVLFYLRRPHVVASLS